MRRLILTIAVLLYATVAHADPHWGGGGHWGGHWGGGGWGGGNAGGAFLGGLAGSLLGGIFQPPAPPPVVIMPPQVPEVQPWTPAWFAWCQSRFRTFDPRTGYYTGYDLRPHFCS